MEDPYIGSYADPPTGIPCMPTKLWGCIMGLVAKGLTIMPLGLILGLALIPDTIGIGTNCICRNNIYLRFALPTCSTWFAHKAGVTWFRTSHTYIG
jgi:hypothetical protein